LDHKNRVALVHNGVIENCDELREELMKKGVTFRSETDTEVIVQLIGIHLDEGLSFLEAVTKAQSRLEGTWGLVIISTEIPDQIIAAKKGSPLLIGIGKDRMFVASEAAAFGQHTKEFIALEDGEVAVVKRDGHSLDVRRIELAPKEKILLTPHPFPHWTIKEIMEQPEAISRALNYGGRFQDESKVKLGGLEENKETLGSIEHLVIAACGTSWHAGLMAAQIMRHLGSFTTVQVVDAAEVTRETFPKKGVAILLISQSGETKDVHRAMLVAQDLGIPNFSVVNGVGSLIARTTHCGVYCNAGRENAVASTKAFTSQVTVLCLIAIWFAQQTGSEESKRKNLIDCMHRLPTNIGMTLKVRDTCQAMAKKLMNAQHMFVLGKGLGEPVAREGALKIKEITYIHAEGFPGGALKHGPFALIEKGTPVILIILDDQHHKLMKTAAAEVKSRGAYTIVISNRPKTVHEVADEVIAIPSNGLLTALLAAIPLQLLAYELAIARDIDPDKPRNLAKTITVD
jgi:glucosamine--fructose-6-phosphate aminotransferase (isomerizing)